MEEQAIALEAHLKDVESKAAEATAASLSGGPASGKDLQAHQRDVVGKMVKVARVKKKFKIKLC